MRKFLLLLFAVFALLAPSFRTAQPTPESRKAPHPTAEDLGSTNAARLKPEPQASRPGSPPATDPARFNPGGPPTTGALAAAAPLPATPTSASADPATAIPARSSNSAEIPPDLVAILSSYDLSQEAQRLEAVARLDELEERRMESVRARAANLGVPLAYAGPDGRMRRLHGFRADGSPLYRVSTNTNAAISSAAAELQVAPYSLLGSGVRVGIWDGGSVRAAHRELTGRVTLKNSSAAIDDHATHVAGTIGASGVTASAKGMAPALAIDSYDWDNDYTEMSAAGAASATDAARLPLSNHSYGYNAVTADMGRYETEARQSDAVAASLPFYLPFWAAGNEQDLLTAQGGYQSITFNGLAKNLLTIGAVNDAVSGGLRSPSAGTISYFSSLGPCDDGRIKPDLVANGVGVYSSIGTGNSAYDTYDGTSMATPSALGSAALLVQLYAREFSGQRMRASLLKALLIHTADDLGAAGPDYTHGWGLLNVRRAADLLLEHKASLASPRLLEGTLTNAQKTASHSFTWDGLSPIRATLAWTDPAGAAQTAADSRTPNLVHNLDLTLSSPGGAVLRPFVMPFVGAWTRASMASPATTGKNNVDNVEQVLVSAPAQAGTYTVTVTVDGTLTTTNQVYSLVISGATQVAANPPPNVTLTDPAEGTTLLSGATLNLAATATDNTAQGSPGLVSGVEFLANGDVIGADNTAPYTLTWTPPAPGTYQLAARATDSEGAAASSAALSLHVLTGDGTPALSGFSPASGAEGATVTLSGANFAGVDTVRFNGRSAAFSVVSLSTLTTTVPAGASSGPISVQTTRGTATSATSFTVLQSPVLISQIYGGGGQTGATFNADYVELHNRGATPVSLTGWSVQYASASGTTWQTTALGGSLAPGAYHLVKLSGGSSGSALPSADSTGSLNLSATSGKVALANSTSAFTGSSPVGQPGLQDFVGYGTAATYEGSGAAPSPSTTTAVFRAGGGATDTGDNAADFAPAAPNPRNSAGGVVAPAITSANAAGGLVGAPFTYQIVASNGPVSYGATPLPSGLTINSSTGLISGTPTLAGTSNLTLSATNSAGTGTASLTLTITASGGGGGAITLLTENFSALSSGDNTTTTGSPTAWAGNTNFPAVAAAYQAGGAVKLGTGSASGSITTRPLDLSANGGVFTVSFKVKGWTTVEGNLVVSVNGANPQTVTYTSVMAGAFESKTLQLAGGGANTTVTFATSARRAYLDDVLISTEAPAAEITLAGGPAALTSTYGAASASPTAFTVSATNLGAPVTVSAPAGFELSQTEGGASGYAAIQTLGSTGNLAASTLHLRLAAGPGVGTYSGLITATSPGAQPRSLPVPTSEVRPKLLSITAQDRLKPFGQTLAPGTSAFDATGLVGSESIGAVTLVASGGTAAHDPIGDYVITPSAAGGGGFDPANYDISYLPGTLTVTGLDFVSWIAARVDPDAAGHDADPDRDGLPNLIEFFLGLEPDTPDAGAGAARLELVDGELRFTYRRSKAQAQFAGHVEWSEQLAASPAWSRSQVADELVSDEGDHELRRARLPWPGNMTRRFVRLSVEPAAAP